MRRVRIRPRADQDLDEQYAYLAEEASVDVAERFLHAAYEGFETVLVMPEMGSPQEHRAPRLVGLRMWPVSGFRDYLIFYRDDEEKGIEVMRVLHGARDIEHALEEEGQDQ